MSTFHKIYKIVVVLLFLIFSLASSAQIQPRETEPALILKTYPIRYIYGMNGEASFQFKNGHLLSAMYQHHDRDFFSIRGRKDPLGLTAIPTLLAAEGYTFYVSYEFPLGNPNITLGPKLGGKFIRGWDDDYEFGDGEIGSAFVNQQNGYLLGQISVRNQSKGFVIESYMQAGIVQIEKGEMFYGEDDALDFEREPERFTSPHILVGFSIGWGI